MSTTGPDPSALTRSTTAAVNVVSVDDCGIADCGSFGNIYVRIVLEETGGQRWTLHATFPGLPVDVVKVGEALELRVRSFQLVTPQAVIGRSSVVLARASTAVLFTVDSVADLADFGISVGRTDARCESSVYAVYAGRVTVGTESRDIAPGETVRLGALSLSFEGFFERTFGDGPERLQHMSGFNGP